MSDPLVSQHLGLPYIAPAQAQKHVTHNEALRRLDAVVQLAVIDSTLSAPPAGPDEGDRYIVGDAATDGWAGHDGEVAFFADGAWDFAAPIAGWIAYDAATEALLVYGAGGWEAIGGFLSPVERFGVNATADDTNRLAVRSNAVLFSNIEAGDGGSGDVRFVVNKEADGDTASLLFQSNWSGRAEVGLAGDTDLVVKVSADGSAWIEAIRVDKDTGLATLLYDNGGSGLAATTVQDAIDEVAAASGGVASVFGRTGAVVAATSDYDANQVDFTPAGGIAASNVQAAVEELDAGKAAKATTVTAGSGLTGGGDLSANRTLNVGAGTGITVNADDVALDTAHDRNVAHSGVTLTAGAGLTGGGDISAARSFAVGAGAGITVNADDVALANMAQSTIKGRAAGAGTGAPVDLSAAQATAILDGFVGDSGSGGTKGLVPAPASGDSGKFLKGNGTWASPGGSGDLLAANNLSDVASAATAFGNLKQAATTSATGVVRKATQADMEAATADRFPDAASVQYAPSAAKFWASVAVASGTPTLVASYNVTSITDTGVGILDVTIATDFSSANWAAQLTVSRNNSGDGQGKTPTVQTQAAGTVTCISRTTGSGGATSVSDPDGWHVMGFGDQ